MLKKLTTRGGQPFFIYEIFNYIPQGQDVLPNFLRNSELSTRFSSKYFLP
jgi:hypothetical protein